MMSQLLQRPFGGSAFVFYGLRQRQLNLCFEMDEPGLKPPIDMIFPCLRQRIEEVFCLEARLQSDASRNPII